MTCSVRRALSAVAVLFALASCGATNTWNYVSIGPVNLSARATADGGGIFSQKYTNFAIYREEADCEFEYAGSVVIDNDWTSKRLPTGERMLIQFNFITQNRFDQGRHHDAFNKLFIARAGSRYELTMEYGKRDFQYQMVEIRPNGFRRVLSLQNLSDCA